MLEFTMTSPQPHIYYIIYLDVTKLRPNRNLHNELKMQKNAINNVGMSSCSCTINSKDKINVFEKTNSPISRFSIQKKKNLVFEANSGVVSLNYTFFSYFSPLRSDLLFL